MPFPPSNNKEFTIEEVGIESLEKFIRSIPFYQDGFVRLQPYNQILPKVFLKYQERIENFKCYPDDIWISSFPKCGTTWTQEMVWCIKNNLDFEEAKAKRLDERVPFVEFTAISDPVQNIPDSFEIADSLERPRILKTHLSVDMLPEGVKEKQNKVIYVSRNPRDTCASLFNHYIILEGYSGTFEDFVDVFLDDVSGYYTPIIHHVLGYWEESKTNPNLLFITYEEMSRNLPKVIRKVSDFLGVKTNYSPEQIIQLSDHLSFKRMKTNPAVNKEDFEKLAAEVIKKETTRKFMNKGKVGNWKDEMTPEMIARFEAWEEKWLKDSDFKFEFEI